MPSLVLIEITRDRIRTQTSRMCGPQRCDQWRMEISPFVGMVWVSFLAAIHVLTFEVPNVFANSVDALEAHWGFDRSADGWARASSVEMDAEVQWQPSGTIRGTVRGPSPHLDSPPFRILANDRQYVAMRMRSSGAATRGRLEIRTGKLPGETDHSLNPWTIRENASIVAEESSSGGASAFFAADGDLTTIWEAASGTNEWVTLDLGDPRDVTAIRLQAPGGNVNPRNVRLQLGPSASSKFTTVVADIMLSNSSDAQEFHVLPSRGRYWRLYILDVHGADRSRLREITLMGPGDKTIPEPLDFEVFNDNLFHVYYLPLYSIFRGLLTQLRLRPGVEATEAVGRWGESLRPNRGDGFEIDWVRIIRAPHIKGVRGCIDAAYTWPDTPVVGTGSAASNVTANDALVNGFLVLGRTLSSPVQGADYGTTSGCLRAGGEAITIVGAAFGASDAQVYIDGSPCKNVEHIQSTEETELTCFTPAVTTTTMAAIAAAANSISGLGNASSGANTNPAVGSYERWMSTVEVVNGRLPGLTHSVRYLAYQAPLPAVGTPSVSNVAARSVDVSWSPPEDHWDALAVTGYQIGWRTVEDGLSTSGDDNDNPDDRDALGVGKNEMRHFMTVGNVTTTTVRGLEPGRQHAFWVRALSENRSDPAVEQVDLYGRRKTLGGVVVGLYSGASEVVATLIEDITFNRFNANATLNHSAIGAGSTLGPRGQWSGEGHYGLQLVGNAHIENCNRSTSCCDDFDASSNSCGLFSEEGPSYTCSAPPVPEIPAQEWTLGAGDSSSVDAPFSSDTQFSTSLVAPAFYTVRLASSFVSISPDSSAQEGIARVSHACGPALRLTASRAASAGAAWYPRDMTVGEGFDTSFTFRLSSPSLRCNILDGVYTHCRSRGADGLAFVVQGEGPTALGRGGMGLGYEGIANMLAVEFDTYYNPDMLDSFENHVSVQTRGWRDPGNAHESYSLGSSTNVPDLTDGDIAVRVVYTPRVTPEDIWHPAFQATAHVGYFFNNGEFFQGGLADWGTGIGILRVYVSNMHEPCLIVPLNLEATLRLHHGRAFVGFTAATGRDTWQVHDVMRWSFTSLRHDIPHWAPPLINGGTTIVDGHEDA